MASYDVTKPLVIDPVLNYSTYLGGSGNDAGLAIAVDTSGNIYVTGLTESGDFLYLHAYSTSLGGIQDGFVAKISQPDLVVTSLSAPSSGGAGSTITVTDTTKNQGGVPAEASTTKFRD